MKRGREQEALETGGYPSKLRATDKVKEGDRDKPKYIGQKADLREKLKVVQLKGLAAEHKAAYWEQKNETMFAQLETLMLQNRVLRAGLGARFLQSEKTPSVKKMSLLDYPSTSDGLASKRFPWLVTKSYMLPQTVMKRICKCMCDDDLFRLRCVSLLFYTAYYEQIVQCMKFPNANAYEFQYKGASFNALRALRLARRGRRFSNVEFMDVNREEMPNGIIMAICKFSFPSLSVLSLEFRFGSLRCLPGNPNLNAMRISIVQEEDSEFVNEIKFPNLRQLRALNKPEDAAVLISPHPAIEFMELYCTVEWRGMQVGKKNFPKLKFLESEHPIPMRTKTRLSKDGVELVGSS